MAIDEIIAEIASLVYRTARGQVYEVCEIEWNEFMESEAPESKRGKMEWIDGEIVLVELGTTECRFRYYRPDLGYGPAPKSTEWVALVPVADSQSRSWPLTSMG
ncbi:hypothetical protein PC116_g17017 [Phytophthora cactorum]|uniref:Uncharacterized protein n=1 Tax=Phytophthora cactorum TaxID=29920 RepID=A0A8T0YXD8_9STRA|nr:hypothetical protein PC111_g12388 [Phytophthora cactorum]KAG2819915.1 hypothetical protein PC112_g11992 [Phytophthora cactorum]KAG2854335.1 hypothetical protein PC113_g13409 [Phytophthora cactorum]KAG2899217.1 hypothetical protein PC114_g13983 [Phytophthora cactorum]KAG2911958.1 hypothetical protein PC115_g12430 [Phytophthora cactorum]